MNKSIQKGLVAFVALFSVGAASAAGIDTAPILTGIADAGTALLAVIGALLSLSVSLFGISKVYSFIKRKAGA